MFHVLLKHVVDVKVAVDPVLECLLLVLLVSVGGFLARGLKPDSKLLLDDTVVRWAHHHELNLVSLDLAKELAIRTQVKRLICHVLVLNLASDVLHAHVVDPEEFVVVNRSV